MDQIFELDSPGRIIIYYRFRLPEAGYGGLRCRKSEFTTSTGMQIEVELGSHSTRHLQVKHEKRAEKEESQHEPGSWHNMVSQLKHPKRFICALILRLHSRGEMEFQFQSKIRRVNSSSELPSQSLNSVLLLIFSLTGRAVKSAAKKSATTMNGDENCTF